MEFGIELNFFETPYQQNSNIIVKFIFSQVKDKKQWPASLAS